MTRLGFKGKIIVPTAVLIVILLTTTTVISVVQYSGFVDYLMTARLETAANGLRDFADEARQTATDLGLQFSSDQRIINAVRDGDTPELLRVGLQLKDELGITFFTIVDQNAAVLARSLQPANFGDTLTQPNILNALRGIIGVEHSPALNWQVPVRATVPIFYDGEIIGSMVAAYALDDDSTLQRLSEQFNAEFTVFVGDTRVASTLVDPSGAPVVGTRVTEPDIVRTVFQQHQELLLTTERFGQAFNGFYLPLVASDGTVFATIFMGLPTWHIIEQQNFVLFVVLGVGATGVIIAILIMFIIAGKLTNPVKRLAGLVEDVSKGNLNVNIDRSIIQNDEIGDLTADVYELVETVKNINDDLSVFAKTIVSDYEYRMDPDKYSGAYKDLIAGVNLAIDGAEDESWVMMQAIEDIGEGNFGITPKVLPGNRVIVNQKLDIFLDQIRNVVAQIELMIDAAAVKGNLRFQIDAAKYKGDWGKMMDGLNSIAGAVNAPVSEIRDVMANLSQGKFDKKVNGNYAGDFLAIRDAVNSTIDILSDTVHEVSLVLNSISDGDLTRKIDRNFVGDFVSIKTSINDISSSLRKSMEEISSASRYVLEGANKITTNAMELADGSSAQAASLEELHTTVELINIQTQKFATNANEANVLSNKSTTNAKRGNDAMKQMMDAMMQIKDSSNNISSIIKVIQDIAFQTNLLSLNAAVEAARAGEHGKGFGVVAEEVRNLAARSQAAAAETTTLIQDSITRVESGADIATETSDSLDIIVTNASDVLELINNITNAASTQAEMVSQISNTLLHTATTVQNNSKFAHESAATAEELNSQSEMLQQLVAQFKL